jgi:hypothetical protein
VAAHDVHCSLLSSDISRLDSDKGAAGFKLALVVCCFLFGEAPLSQSPNDTAGNRPNGRSREGCAQNATCNDRADTREQECSCCTDNASKSPAGDRAHDQAFTGTAPVVSMLGHCIGGRAVFSPYGISNLTLGEAGISEIVHSALCVCSVFEHSYHGSALSCVHCGSPF